MSKPATVHVIDDDARMRSLLTVLFAGAPTPIEVHESAEEFLNSADLQAPGCILLDLQMPGVGGMELLRTLKTMRCDMPVIVLSGQVDVTLAVRSMGLGAMDVLQKPFEPEALLAAVKLAIAQSELTHETRIEQANLRKRFASLTARETELLRCLVAGNSNKEIATNLHISVKTVCNHRASLMAKTRAVNGPDLVRLCLIAGTGDD